MDKTFAIIRREFTERVRSRWFVIGTLFGPVLLAVLMFLPAWLATRSRPSDEVARIVILDASGSALGSRLVATLTRGAIAPVVREIEPAALTAAESTATREVIQKTFTGYLVIDALTLAGERARYAGRNASTVADMRTIEGAVTQAVLSRRFEDAGLDAARVRALSQVSLQFRAERLSESGRGDTGRNAIGLAYTVAMMLYMSIVLYGQSILMGVVEEKTQRVAEVVVASVSPARLLTGKVIGVGSVGLLQMLVWVLSALTLMHFSGPIGRALGFPMGPGLQIPSVSIGTAVAFLTYFVLGYALFSTLFAAAGSMVSSTQDAQQVVAPLMLLIIPSLLLLTPVLMEPNGTLARVVTLVPFSAPILMPVRMSLTAVPPFELLVSMVLLVLTCLLAILVAGRIYRTGVLMYGKKPSLREVLRWVRVAR
jgi:ABC-2 type transport system permease protein